MPEQKDLEIAELKNLIEQLNAQTSRNEREKQNMRYVRRKLDMQIDYFKHIHGFSQRAFTAADQKTLRGIIAEGVVDIFQLEVGIIFDVNVAADKLTVSTHCNLDGNLTSLPVQREWLARRELLDFRGSGALIESPVESAPISLLGLKHAIYMPLFDNRREIEGIILGGITEDSAEIYDFYPDELASPFMVYCQQMNGISNNLTAVSMANAAGEAKSRFLANLSHEIRTPMNAILGMVQVAQRSQDFDAVKSCIDQIDASSRHLLGLLNDVLDLSKIEEGKITLNHEPFFLDAVVDHIVSSMSQSAQMKELEFSTDIHGIHAMGLIGDSIRLSQILINLVSNAIKFTPDSGKVHIDVKESSRNDGKVLIDFKVSDTGIGISAETADIIFAPFEQGDSSSSRKYGGTGLGLSISQKLAELMGSRIKLSSAEGQGSTFYFSVWFDIDEKAADYGVSVGGEAPDFSGRNILVVDDVEINREIIYAFMEGTGAVCHSAENGQEAVDMFVKSEPGFFDMILMDVQMPVMDGCAATRAMRGMGRPDSRDTVILAMTANVFKEDMQQVADAGMNGHIGKPVEYEATLKTIERIFNKKPKMSYGGAPPAEGV